MINYNKVTASFVNKELYFNCSYGQITTRKKVISDGLKFHQKYFIPGGIFHQN